MSQAHVTALLSTIGMSANVKRKHRNFGLLLSDAYTNSPVAVRASKLQLQTLQAAFVPDQNLSAEEVKRLSDDTGLHVHLAYIPSPALTVLQHLRMDQIVVRPLQEERTGRTGDEA